MLALAIGLGVWQVHRLHWKTALLAEIDRAEAAPPVPLPAQPAAFEKVTVTGRFRDDLAASYGSEVRSTAAGPALGARLLMPLERDGGPPIIVDRGWLPEHVTVRDEGAVDVVGYVRPRETAGWLSPKTDLAARRFWALDPAAIGAALGLGEVAPFTLVALASTGGAPDPAHTLPRPANDHLAYAATWFGLAACLVGIFIVYVRRTLRP